MKTKEQILRWIDKQPWKCEFYKAAFLCENQKRVYNANFLISAFHWGETVQEETIWSERNKEYQKWYNTKDRPNSWKEYYVCDHIDKAFIEGYNTALYDAAEWFTEYLKAGNTFSDWLNSGMEKFFSELGE